MRVPEAPDAPRRGLQAQTDLHERALREFLQTIARWTDDSLTERLAADATWTNQKILGHVVGCIYLPYFDWMLKKLDLNPVPRPFSDDRDEANRYLQAVDSIARWRQLLEAAVPYVRAVTAQMTDDDLGKAFPCAWGERYSVDQMFEHATMHLYRHIRQIERDRAAKGAIAGA